VHIIPINLFLENYSNKKSARTASAIGFAASPKHLHAQCQAVVRLGEGSVYETPMDIGVERHHFRLFKLRGKFWSNFGQKRKRADRMTCPD
jgi:hypothetical protein